MPTEQEELRLTVNLADNASAGLAKLNEEIRQLGSGASQQHIEKFKRETTETTRKVKEMGNEVGEAYKGLGMLRTGLAAGAAGLSLFGFEMARQVKIIVDYADKIRTLNQQARQIGVNPSQLKDVTEQLQAFGISGETAASSISAVSGKIAELQRQGSQLRMELLKNAGPDRESVRNMSQYLDRLTNAKTVAEQLNIIREGGEQVYNNARKQGYSEQEAANRRNNFWQLQGYNAQLANAGKLKELSAEEKRIADERAARAEAFSNQIGSITRKWNEMVEASNQPMLQNLKAVLEYAEPMLDRLKSFMEWMQKNDVQAPPGLSGFAEAQKPVPYAKEPPEGEFLDQVRQLVAWSRKSMDELKKSLDEHNKTIKELNDAIKGGPGSFQPTGFDGSGGGGLLHRATFTTPSGRQPMFGGGGGLWGGGSGRMFGGDGGGAPYGSDVGAGTGAGAGAAPAARGTPGAGPFTVPKGGDPRGMEPYIRETAKKYGVDPDTAVKVAASEGLRDFLGDRGKSGGAFQLYTGGGLGNEFQKQTGLDPLDPKNEKATIDYALKNVARTGWGPYHGAKRLGVGRREGIGGLPNGQTAGPGTGYGAPGDAAGSVPKPVLDEAKALLIRGGGSGELQQFMASKGYPRSGAWCGQFTASVVAEAGGKPPRNAAVASNWLTWGQHVDPSEVREGDVAVRTRSRYGGRAVPGQTGSHVGLVGSVGEKSIDMIGGNQGRPVTPRSRWGGEWEFRRGLAEDRQQIDRTQSSTTKVEGTGKISVDVNAPKGTGVGAEGGGLFKDVEINRQTQMEPARRGPAQEVETLSI